MCRARLPSPPYSCFPGPKPFWFCPKKELTGPRQAAPSRVLAYASTRARLLLYWLNLNLPLGWKLSGAGAGQVKLGVPGWGLAPEQRGWGMGYGGKELEVGEGEEEGPESFTAGGGRGAGLHPMLY